MSVTPLESLRRMLQAEGKAVCQDRARCEVLMSRALEAVNKPALTILRRAVQQDVPYLLLNPPEAVSREAFFLALIKKLQAKGKLQAKHALWAIQTWGIALEVLTPRQAKTLAQLLSVPLEEQDEEETLAIRLEGERLSLPAATEPIEAPPANGESIRLHSNTLCSLEGDINSVLSFSEDGKTLLTGGSRHGFQVQENPNGCILSTPHGQEYPVTRVAYNYDGQLMAAADWHRRITVWEVYTGKTLQTFTDHHRERVRSLDFGPDERLLVSAGGQEIRLWDVVTGAQLAFSKEHEAHVNAVTFSPNGNWLASASDDRSVRLWRIRTRVAKDGRTLQATMRCVQVLNAHQAAVTAVKFSPAGDVFVSAGADDTVKLWHLSPRHFINPLRLLAAPAKLLHALPEEHQGTTGGAPVFSPDGSLLATSDHEYRVMLWEIETGRLLHVLHGHQDKIVSLSFHPQGHILASGSCDHTVRLWDTDSGDHLNTLHGGQNYHVSAVNFTPQGKIVTSGSFDKTMVLQVSRQAG